MLTYQIEPLDVFLLQSMQDSGEIPTMRAQVVVVFRVPPLLEIRGIGRVVELEYLAAPQEVDYDPGSDGIGADG